MDGNTYIKLYRKFKDWRWYQHGSTKDVFVHLLIDAEWKDVHKKGVLVKRGQCLTTEKRLSEELGFTRQEIRTALSHLASTGEVTRQTVKVLTNGRTNQMSLITVEKYSSYQAVDNFYNQAETQAPTEHQPSTNQTTYFIRSNKNINNINNNARVRHADGVPVDNNDKFTPIMKPEYRARLDEMREDIRRKQAAALAAAERETSR